MTRTSQASFAVGSWAFSATHGESVRILDVRFGLEPHRLSRSGFPGWPRSKELQPDRSFLPSPENDRARPHRIRRGCGSHRRRIDPGCSAGSPRSWSHPAAAPTLRPHSCDGRGPDSLPLADEVGLGKTIEAGLIFRELKLRGLVKRVLVVAPKGLVTQWVQEMQTHFGEEFQLLTPSEFSLWRNLTGSENIWRTIRSGGLPR